MMMHTLNQCPYQVSRSCTLQSLTYSLDKFFPTDHPLAHLDVMGESNTCTALKGCGIKRQKCDLMKSNKIKVTTLHCTTPLYRLHYKLVYTSMG